MPFLRRLQLNDQLDHDSFYIYKLDFIARSINEPYTDIYYYRKHKEILWISRVSEHRYQITKIIKYIFGENDNLDFILN